MKNITAKYLILFYIMMMMTTISFGAQNDWVLTDTHVDISDPSNHSLLGHKVIGTGILISPYCESKPGESFIKQLYFKFGQNQKINLGSYDQYAEKVINNHCKGGILDKISLSTNRYYLVERGDEKAYIQVKGINTNYYEKWKDFADSFVCEKGDKIDFHINHDGKEIVQSLYGQADIKQVREYLRQGKRFAINWLNDSNIPNIVVMSFEQNCTICWDGWKPELGGDSDRLGMLEFVQPHEININLNENNKAEEQYKHNKNISRVFLFGTFSFMVWLFWNKLIAIKDAIVEDWNRERTPFDTMTHNSRMTTFFIELNKAQNKINEIEKSVQ